MKSFGRLITFISSLHVAIFLLIVIAIASGIGTIIPQQIPHDSYLTIYNENPWLGVINGDLILLLQLNHIYTSFWFLFLMGWLGLALISCSWRRQWPSLQAALKWIDYQEPSQLSKLAIAQTVSTPLIQESLANLSSMLSKKGWQIKNNPNRFAARKGVVGRCGPILVHIGLILLMIGSVWGALSGQKIERFLAPGKSLDLLDTDGVNQITFTLENFNIDRDAIGRAEQFRSKLKISKPNQTSDFFQEISVNHPLRFEGITIYQADWALAAITLQIGESPKLQLPLKSLPELGDQMWGLVLPTRADGSEPVLLTMTSEQGPVQFLNPNGEVLAKLRPGGVAKEVKGIPVKVTNILPTSGLILKRDPGVPLVYTGFAITLLGGGLSIIATRQLWAIADPTKSFIHVGGLCNRDLTGLSKELPQFIEAANKF